MESKEENILGTEKIGKLIRKFSIPCIISMLVNSLYNIVDQIFIGWGVGYLGNGATNVVFLITMICLAFALMIGDGSSAYLSLKLGEKKKEEATKGVANGIVLSVILSICFCLIALIFLTPLLNIFGCTDALRDYAISYGRIIAMGIPFMVIGTSLNSIIRADGSPKFAMTSMVLGAILNIILDPIFIFVFKMGVAGAAIATIFSQFITFVLNVFYLRKTKSVKLRLKEFKPIFSVMRKVLVLGISSFITQMSFVLVVAVQNNLFTKYGKLSKYGPEIPITVTGIVMKINQILNSVIIGIAVGAQPIFGYNYGARKFDRVKKTLKIVLTTSLIISTIAFLLFQLIPDVLISIFGSGDALYMEFACITFRTFLMLCICNGVQIPSGIFFQAIGKSSRSIILSLSRQVIFLVPAMLILGHAVGLLGVLYAGPVADGMAFVMAVILLILEMRKLKVGKEENVDDDSNIVKAITEGKKVVIAIAREYGSGGRYIGRLVAEKLGIGFYDNEFITKMAKETGLSSEYIEEIEQRRTNLEDISNYTGTLSNSDELFIKESEFIKKLAKNESCVIIGRCADFVLKDNKNVIKVFVYNSMENKIKRATKYYGLDKVNAEKEIKKINKQRATHYSHYAEREWNEPSNYDLCINSDSFGVEESAEMICEYYNKKAGLLALK